MKLQSVVGFAIRVTYVILKSEFAIENTQDFVDFHALLIFIDVCLSQWFLRSNHSINTFGNETYPVLFTKSRSIFTQNNPHWVEEQICMRMVRNEWQKDQIGG